MANFNKILLVGNLTRDPQVKFLPSQMAVCEFGLAVNNKYKTKSGEDREEVLFIDCTAFGKSGEIIQKYCQKGKQLLIEGRLKYDTWEDKNGGGKRSKHSVVIDNFQFLGGRDEGGGAGGGGGGYGNQSEQGQGDGGYDQRPRPTQSRSPQSGRPAPQRTPQEDQPFNEEQQFKEDDIPF